MITVWIRSPYSLIARALGELLRPPKYKVQFEKKAADLALWDLRGDTLLPSPAPQAIPTLALLDSEKGDEDLARLLCVGYRGYLYLAASRGDLEDALEALHRGEIWAERHILTKALDGQDNGNSMTAQQHQVMALVAQGLSNRQVASELGIAVGTVKTHLHEVFKKLGVKHRYQLACVH